MQDSTKNMSLLALSNRYKEAISRLEGAVAEALNEIQFCDFLYSPSYNEDWAQFVSAKKSVAEADIIVSYINGLWYEIAMATATTSELRTAYCFCSRYSLYSDFFSTIKGVE